MTRAQVSLRCRSLSSAAPSPRPKKPRRAFDPSKYSTRFIALKFAYLGQRYNGFEHHANNTTPLPTIEEVLWNALNKARLIFPTDDSNTTAEVKWDGCNYSKCGRTDRGVSAFGQVISLRVRSNRPLARSTRDSPLDKADGPTNETERAAPSLRHTSQQPDILPPLVFNALDESQSFNPITDEIPYVEVLNRLLPPDIRILAWCPTPPPEFSSRFSCRERRYRYFFTQPAFMPIPGGLIKKHDTEQNRPSGSHRREGWLDIDAMKDGAQRFEGLHDFRNFCKVDASKQIDNFQRRIFHADIIEIQQTSEPAAFVHKPAFSELPGSLATNGPSNQQKQDPAQGTPKVYAFVLHGSAFLWHQVRHMVAILFLIGQGFETPDLVTKMLDVHANPAKPMYEMAEDAPLVLWDCIFPRDGSDSHEDAMEWIYVGDQSREVAGPAVSVSAHQGGKYGTRGLVEELWKVWRQRKMDELLAGTLLNEVVAQGTAMDIDSHQQEGESSSQGAKPINQKVFGGGDEARLRGKYVPILERPWLESVETINARYAARKGIEKKDDVKDAGHREIARQRRGDHVE